MSSTAGEGSLPTYLRSSLFELICFPSNCLRTPPPKKKQTKTKKPFLVRVRIIIFRSFRVLKQIVVPTATAAWAVRAWGWTLK